MGRGVRNGEKALSRRASPLSFRTPIFVLNAWKRLTVGIVCACLSNERTSVDSMSWFIFDYSARETERVEREEGQMIIGDFYFSVTITYKEFGAFFDKRS